MSHVSQELEHGYTFALGHQGRSLQPVIRRKCFTETLHCIFSHLIDEQAEVQRDQAICSRSQKYGVKKVKFKSKSIRLQSQ